MLVIGRRALSSSDHAAHRTSPNFEVFPPPPPQCSRSYKHAAPYSSVEESDNYVSKLIKNTFGEL